MLTAVHATFAACKFAHSGKRRVHSANNVHLIAYHCMLHVLSLCFLLYGQCATLRHVSAATAGKHGLNAVIA